MKIAVIGHSGSGKSTLARELGQRYGTEVLYLDSVQFLPGWEIRSEEEKEEIVKAFLDTHDSWIMDGNYAGLLYERRMGEADRIVILLFSRFTCLRRVIRRYFQYQNTTRPSMAEGCKEKPDWEFVGWILHEGRTKARKNRYRNIISRYKGKVIVVKNQRQLTACLKEHFPG